MNDKERSYSILKNKLLKIFFRNQPPRPEDMMAQVRMANDTFLHENPVIRPYDSDSYPGGLVLLSHDIDTLIIPDLHGRLGDLLRMLFAQSDTGRNFLEDLLDRNLQIVCVGDGMHCEGHEAQRWNLAYREYLKEYRIHTQMDLEMRESFGLMEMVMELKNSCPGNFHFLKGNHENIKNENGFGNHAFMKYAREGEMVELYVKKFYGSDFLEEYSEFEKNLPLLAAGKNFVVSHAEPASFYSKEMVINYRKYPDVIEGLTWTDDDSSEDGTVRLMIDEYINPSYRERAYYFGGHRAVSQKYSSRSGGKYLQIHNPEKCMMVKIRNDKEIDPDQDIIEITDKDFLEKLYVPIMKK